LIVASNLVGVLFEFCVKLRKNGANTFEMLKTAFGDERLSRAGTLY